MTFITRVDYSNRQIKQYMGDVTHLSGSTVFGVDDSFIPINFTGDTINVDALQFIRARGMILYNPVSTPLPLFTGSTYQNLARDYISGKVVVVSGSSGGGGGIPQDLQSVSDIGSITTNTLTSSNIIGFTSDNGDGIFSRIGYTPSQSGFLELGNLKHYTSTVSNLNVTGNTSYQLPNLPILHDGSFFPFSVNNVYADNMGNITLPMECLSNQDTKSNDFIINNSQNNTLVILNSTTNAKSIIINSGMTENFAIEFINTGIHNWEFFDTGTGILNYPDGTLLRPGRVAMLFQIGSTNEFWLKGELE